MHDIRLIRDNPEAFDAGLARRGLEPLSAQFLDWDVSIRARTTHLQQCQSRRKQLSDEFGTWKRKGVEAPLELQTELASLKETMPKTEAEIDRLKKRLDDALAALPNLPAPDVPDGADEDDNVEIARWGTPRTFDFEPQEHADFAPALGLDFETAAKMSGARFAFLKAKMARLERALGQFMLDKQTGKPGYVECAAPLLVRSEALFGTGQLPKFADDSFSTSIPLDKDKLLKIIERAIEGKRGEYTSFQESDFESIKTEVFDQIIEDNKTSEFSRRWLIPTSEVSLTNAVREEILPEAELPVRMTALTPCFRSEAGSAGRDTRGYIRQHQFWKVELVSIVRPEDSDAELERKTRAAETILEALELPYRKMLLCSGDMGFAARKTYDLEVWLPGQNAYREISSCSNCGDFQARRMNTRFRREGAKSNEFVHTLNGSGLAVGRTLVAILENYQQADGSVDIPKALLPYMGGITKLTPSAN